MARSLIFPSDLPTDSVTLASSTLNEILCGRYARSDVRVLFSVGAPWPYSVAGVAEKGARDVYSVKLVFGDTIVRTWDELDDLVRDEIKAIRGNTNRELCAHGQLMAWMESPAPVRLEVV